MFLIGYLVTPPHPIPTPNNLSSRNVVTTTDLMKVIVLNDASKNLFLQRAYYSHIGLLARLVLSQALLENRG